jgi:Domain of unknown function (DUF1919)
MTKIKDIDTIMETIILSNTCIGADVINKIYKGQYNNPFIATLIPNDEHYVKLCNNITHYIMDSIPVLGGPGTATPFCIQNRGQWYKHSAIPAPYPVIYLDDVEIHCIHESSAEEALAKFTRRLERMREIMRTRSYRIIPLFSFGELINDHADINAVIDRFMICRSEHIIPLFIGPRRYHREAYGKHYIIADCWERSSLTRSGSHIYIFNDQKYAEHMFINAIQHL